MKGRKTRKTRKATAMMKNDYKVRAFNFLKSLYPYIEGSLNDPYECADGVMAFNEEKHRKVGVAWGSVRVAFISSDYVVKYDYDEVYAKRYGGCEDEEEFYKFAKEKGFENLFAEISSFEYMGRTFYVMPRVNMRASQEGGRAEYYLDGAELEFVDNYLYDLHDENFGWKNNRLVIFDYAYNVFMEQKNYKG
jgi:hypothetical protein